MNKKFPSIIEKLHESNEFDLDKFIHCGIPFIRLDLKVPEISKTVFNETVKERSEERRVEKECRSRWSPYPMSLKLRNRL